MVSAIRHSRIAYHHVDALCYQLRFLHLEDQQSRYLEPLLRNVLGLLSGLVLFEYTEPTKGMKMYGYQNRKTEKRRPGILKESCQ